MKRLLFLLPIAVCCLPFTRPQPTRAQDETKGYWQYGYFIPGLITNGLWYQPPPHYFVTRATYQAEGLLEETARIKGYDTSGVDGLVALMSPATVGWKVWIRNPVTGLWLRVLDADSVARRDYYYHVIYTHSALELSYALAQDWGMIDWVNPDHTRYFWDVQVCIEDSPVLCIDKELVNYEDWFRSVLRFVP